MRRTDIQSSRMFCTQNENRNPNDERSNFARFAGAFLLIMITTIGGFYIWDNYFSEIGKARRFAQEQTAALQKAESAYVKAMTEDTYGGKTPQETLDLFIDALKKGDVDLASKYFLLKEDEGFSREKWMKILEKAKNDGIFLIVANNLMTAIPNPDDSINENDFKFVIFGEDGLVKNTINLQFNSLSKVWKIENL